MHDPYQILGLPPDADDKTIRQRYLKLVREYGPDRHPEKFMEIRQAYELLKDEETRLQQRLFEAGKSESVDKIIKELSCRKTRRRMSLKDLSNPLGRTP
ncbi:MAG: J domain-containing protein [Gemmataceae bacterium]